MQEKTILDGGMYIEKLPDGSKEYRNGKKQLIKKVFPDGIVEDYSREGKLLKRKFDDKTDFFDKNEQLKIREEQTRESTNFYNGTHQLLRSVFDDERTEHYFGPLKGKTVLKDGTIIDTPKPSDTPTTRIPLGPQSTQVLETKPDSSKKNTHKEKKEAIERVFGAPTEHVGDWETLTAGWKGSSKIEPEKTPEEGASKETQVIPVEDLSPEGEMPEVKNDKKKKTINQISRFKKNLKKLKTEGGLLQDKALEIAKHHQGIELLMKEKRELKAKQNLTEEEKARLVVVKKNLKDHDRDLKKLFNERMDSYLTPQEIEDLSIEDEIPETVLAPYKEPAENQKNSQETEKAETLKKLQEIMERATKRLAEIDIELAEIRTKKKEDVPPVIKTPEILETKIFSTDFIEEQILSLLGSDNAKKTIKKIIERPKVRGDNDEITLNTKVSVKTLSFAPNADVGIQAILENKNGAILVKSYNIDANLIVKGQIEERLIPYLNKITETLKDFIERKEGKKVEKIEIENGQLKVSFKK
jgi:hypothetical protein